MESMGKGWNRAYLQTGHYVEKNILETAITLVYEKKANNINAYQRREKLLVQTFSRFNVSALANVYTTIRRVIQTSTLSSMC